MHHYKKKMKKRNKILIILHNNYHNAHIIINIITQVILTNFMVIFDLFKSWQPTISYEKEQREHSSKDLLLSFTEWRKSNKFEMTWMWINDDKMISGSTNYNQCSSVLCSSKLLSKVIRVFVDLERALVSVILDCRCWISILSIFHFAFNPSLSLSYRLPFLLLSLEDLNDSSSSHWMHNLPIKIWKWLPLYMCEDLPCSLWYSSNWWYDREKVTHTSSY